MRQLPILLMGFCALIFSVSAFAQTERYDLEKPHTQILFFVDHLGFSKSQGEFLDFKGGFVFDKGTPENSTIDVTIRTASIDMDDDKWNAHMKSKDFFDVEQYPTMRFVSQSILVTGENTASVTGDLTMIGQTKPVTLNVTYNKSGIHPFSQKYIAGFSVQGTIKRSEFGMNYGLPALGDDVELRIEVEGIRKDEGIYQE